jgi:hypothetical protein
LNVLIYRVGNFVLALNGFFAAQKWKPALVSSAAIIAKKECGVVHKFEFTNLQQGKQLELISVFIKHDNDLWSL